ncbi:glycosyltransferase family 2 protein [Hanstruepera flava]|uniref:glycosyltransferase family 2 protein n=1 Tax=Hanstruepera flava TaxID=2930218 RepID=UPI002028F93F|nr:glycosyltransferase [Hanstruepera flava]
MISAIIFLIISIYALLIGGYIYGFNKAPDFFISDIQPQTKFTIIIVFRNEAENLPELIESLKNLNYSRNHFEIIFVNDDSTDNSIEIIKTNTEKTHLDFQLINRDVKTNSPKKDAIQTAVRNVKSSWIITTDADCIVPKYWLDFFDACIQQNTYRLIAGPVSYRIAKNPLSQFQTLDFISLMGTTIGSFGLKKPFMANGANLAYEVELFHELNGFDGNSHIASGDDVFLLQKARKANPKYVGFLKNNKALVLTKPVQSLNTLIKQRIRWASKSTAYSSVLAKFTGLIVLAMNMLVISTIGFALVDIISWNSCLYIWVIKLSVDFILLFKTIRFLKQETIISSYFWSSIVHPFFICYVAILSLFKGYEWKNRHFKK